MIKFFRKIRYNLMEKGKTGKYFKYAIGEILLVVIGILIALQINNWNERKKERAQEQELLTQLQSEFTSNLEQLDQKNDLRNQMISASLKLLHYIDNPESRNTDSIIKYLAITCISPTFDPIVNDINSSGRIQLLKNTSLKEKLARWTSEVIQVTEEEQVWIVNRNYNYLPLLNKFGVIRTLLHQYWKDNVIASFHLDEGTKIELDFGNSKKEIIFSKLIENAELESHIAQCASYGKITNSQAKSLRQRIIEILDLIKLDLN